MTMLKKWAIGFLLGASCAGIWWTVDTIFFKTSTLDVYIAVMCAYATGYVTASR